jgi:hypothetical protein
MAAGRGQPLEIPRPNKFPSSIGIRGKFQSDIPIGNDKSICRDLDVDDARLLIKNDLAPRNHYTATPIVINRACHD